MILQLFKKYRDLDTESGKLGTNLFLLATDLIIFDFKLFDLFLLKQSYPSSPTETKWGWVIHVKAL